ncbi:MAG TPA: TIGR02206 family membrane protein [Verrucomicrobiales bacterium]|nr:TIGR02206 family membrane protein [Verrucomicrobiales bacterium]
MRFPEPKFHPLGADHFAAVVFLGVLLTFLFVQAWRLGPDHPAVRLQGAALGWLTFLSYPFHVLALWISGDLGRTADQLPMHLCNWAGFLTPFALLFRRPLLVELVYFWGLAGTLQALITPNLFFGFPHPFYFTFFSLHGGVVVAALYLVAGLKLHPRPGAALRAWLWLQGYGAVALAINLLSSSNYGFLRQKPARGSLMDLMGPWPWYLLALELLALGAFALLNLPFALLRRRDPSRTHFLPL